MSMAYLTHTMTGDSHRHPPSDGHFLGINGVVNITTDCQGGSTSGVKRFHIVTAKKMRGDIADLGSSSAD